MYINIILFFVGLIVGLAVLLWIFFICKAILFKIRSGPRRHVKSWVPQIFTTGRRSAGSPEMIFTPLVENEEIPTDRENTTETFGASTTSSQRSTMDATNYHATLHRFPNSSPNGTECSKLSNGTGDFTVEFRAEKEARNEGGVTLTNQTTPFPEVHTTVLDTRRDSTAFNQSQQLAVIPSTNESITI